MRLSHKHSLFVLILSATIAEEQKHVKHIIPQLPSLSSLFPKFQKKSSEESQFSEESPIESGESDSLSTKLSKFYYSSFPNVLSPIPEHKKDPVTTFFLQQSSAYL